MQMTKPLIAVAVALLSAPEDKHWGYELSRQTGVRSGVLYPLLGRLLDEGWLEDGWEDPVEVGRKRPPRRYYQVTEEGLNELGAVAKRAPAGRPTAKVRFGPKVQVA